jgi:cytochrome c biogenesis protein
MTPVPEHTMRQGVRAAPAVRRFAAPAGGPAALLGRGVRAMASPRLTLAAMMLLAAGVVRAHAAGAGTTWPLVLPLALVSVNLAAAMATHPAFRRSAALLWFHVALLAIVGLVALGRLTYLTGHLELAAGERFEGRLTGYTAGPWHPWGITAVRFANAGFTIDYLPGRMRDRTEHRVRYADGAGRLRDVIIGDQVPLVLGGYRFYTTHNKGFALTFFWRPHHGAPQRGTVHLPAYPLHEYRQANTWTPPGSARELWVQLRFDEPLLAPAGPARFRTPGSHLVVVRAGERRAELGPGMRLALDDGLLTYEGVRTWMGYKVFYDPTTPWLLAACGVAVASLGWHLWRQSAAGPWLTRATTPEKNA